MTDKIAAIILAIQNYPFFAIVCTIPIIAITVIRHKTFNIVRIGLNYAMLLYTLCLIAVVFFPLPTPEQAAMLSGYKFQAVPFMFVADIIRETSFNVSNPITYVTCLSDTVVLQVVLNVVMTMPLGMFLRYYYGVSGKKIVLISLGVSLFIEITQLTGLYGVYHGSYRICDVDDLMTNTLGGYLGYRVVAYVENFIPSIAAFDAKILHKRNLTQAR